MINNTEQETISIIQLTQQSSLAYQKVLAYVKDQNFVKANEYLIKGNETLLEASKIHAGCLTVSSDLDLLLGCFDLEPGAFTGVGSLSHILSHIIVA